MNRPRFPRVVNISNWPLSLRLTMAVVALLVPATVAIAAIVVLVLQNIVTAQVGNNLHTIAESTARRTADQLEAEVSKLQLLARNPAIVADIEAANGAYSDSESPAREELAAMAADWAAAQPGDPVILAHQNLPSATDLRIFINTDPNNSELFTTDRHGGLVAITSRPANFDNSRQVWWHLGYNDGVGYVFLSSPQFDPAGGAYSLEIGVPVFQPNTVEVIGVLHARYRLQSLINDFADIQVGQTGEAMLLADRGQRLDTTSLNLVLIDPSEWAPLRHSTADWQIGPLNSRLSVIGRAPVSARKAPANVGYLGWIVIIHQDLTESLAAPLAVVRLAVIIAVIGLIITLLFTALVARALTRPIVTLTNVARQAQAGNLQITAPVQSRDEVGVLSEAFNSMIGEIRSFTGSLEAKVAERTAQLAAVNEIAATVAASLDINEVLSKTVNLIRDRLGYYHVSVFLLDDKSEYAVLRESTGEPGRLLKERGHQLGVGSQSIIGYVTANRKARIALDTITDAVHFKNPLLPNTRSEMALPLIVGDRLFGALDVQSSEPNAFDEQDVAVLQNMANQIAVAINNARHFQEARQRLNEITLLNRQYLARAWEAFANAHPESVNLQLRGGQVNPAPEFSVRNYPVTINAPVLSADGTTIAIPIVLRDEIIGEFVLGAPDGTTHWGQDELTLVEAVVAQAALAVENARLLEETQAALAESNRLARRERVISEITNKITFGADVKRILQIAADELRRATGSSRAVVRLTGAAAEETT